MGRLRNNLIVADSEDCDPAYRRRRRAFPELLWECRPGDFDRPERPNFEANLDEQERIDGLS